MLEISGELNYTAATKLRVVVFKRCFKATLNMLESSWTHRCPDNCSKAPAIHMQQRRSEGRRAHNGRHHSLHHITGGRFQYVMLAADVYSRHIWGKPMGSAHRHGPWAQSKGPAHGPRPMGTKILPSHTHCSQMDLATFLATVWGGLPPL